MKNEIDIEEENKDIVRRYKALLRSCNSEITREDKKLIRKAFNLAVDATKCQKKSGEPYIFHPIAVAQIVAKDIGLDATSIACALLHDVVEDTEYTLNDIEKLSILKLGKSLTVSQKFLGFRNKTSLLKQRTSEKCFLQFLMMLELF